MLKKGAAILIIALSISGIIILLAKINPGATAQQSESLKNKQQSEQQDARILNDKDTARAEVVSDTQVSPVSDKPDLFSDDDKYEIVDPKTYIDENFIFSVDYPDGWKIQVEKTWGATSTQEASPDGGIDIYIEGDKNERISIIGQLGTMSGYLDYPQEDFITKDLEKGKLSYTEKDDRYDIYLVLDENHHGAVIHVSKACFTRNKQQILGILKSIKLLNSK